MFPRLAFIYAGNDRRFILSLVEGLPHPRRVQYPRPAGLIFSLRDGTGR